MDSEEEEGYGGKGMQKRKVLSQTWNSEGLETDDESGESMELMEEVPLIGLVWVRIGEINMCMHLTEKRRELIPEMRGKFKRWWEKSDDGPNKQNFMSLEFIDK